MKTNKQTKMLILSNISKVSEKLSYSHNRLISLEKKIYSQDSKRDFRIFPVPGHYPHTTINVTIKPE